MVGSSDGAVSAYDMKMSQYAASVPTAKMDAAISSRSFLSSNVEILPFPVSENIVVRSFGRIKVERDAIRAGDAGASGKKKKSKSPKDDKDGDGTSSRVEPLYSSAASIHPVGFSCDRFEFSPIHGRMIRLRCDILDGAKVQNLRNAQKKAEVMAKRAAKAKKTREENKRKKEEAEAAAAAAAAAAATESHPEVKADGTAAAQSDATPSSAAGAGQPSAAAAVASQGPLSVASTVDPAPAASSAPAPAPAVAASGVADTELETKSSNQIKEEEQTSGEASKDTGTEDASDDLLTPLLTLDDDDDYNGPIFRVMWGAGIEQNPENDYSYPYDVYSASAPLTDDVVDAVAVPLDGSGHVLGRSMVPEVGMRVSVRFDETRWYGGTITKVKDDSKKGGKKLSPGQRLLSIDYDDGNQEEAAYPDPDILLRPPGTSS